MFLKFGLTEKHINLKKSSAWFGHLLSKRPNHEEDFFKFCVLLRKSELYFGRIEDTKSPFEIN